MNRIYVLQSLRGLSKFRNHLTLQRTISYQKLDNRSFISISGDKSHEFLQGLITNDTDVLDRPEGRCLFDLFVYNTKKYKELGMLVECDDKARPSLMKVEIKANDTIHSYIAMPSSEKKNLSELSSWGKDSVLSNKKYASHILFYAADPRAVPGWSGRILFKKKVADTSKREDISPIKSYTRARYRLGIPEGVNEIKVGEALPLDCNGDLNGGISFTKGCYIGQELTARTRFTGVIRRRIIPISVVDSDIEKRPIGWIRALLDVESCENNRFREGIALIRLSDAVLEKGESLVVMKENSENHVQVKVYVPEWWPDNVETKLDRIELW